MAHPLLVKAADSGTVASDGGSGVLIMRGVTGRLLRKSGQPNKVPPASKTSTDSAGACFAVPSFHLTMRLSTNPFLLSTPNRFRGKVRPRAEAENAALVRSVTICPRPHGAVFVVLIDIVDVSAANVALLASVDAVTKSTRFIGFSFYGLNNASPADIFGGIGIGHVPPLARYRSAF